VSAKSCTAIAAQQWTRIESTSGHFLLKNKGNGLCLDVPFNESKDGLRLITAECHGAPQQQWRQGSPGHRGHTLVSLGTQKCMDKSWDTVVQWRCHDGWWQYWRFEGV
jgi:hypothetical protein